MTILLKDAREAAAPEDGARVLVDRRRVQGEAGEVPGPGNWLPELAPSAELQRWFNWHPSQWQLFRRRYLVELCKSEAVESLIRLETIAAHAERMTLLTASEDMEHSHAAILRDLLDGVKKPPATSGPARAAAGARMRARRPR